VTRTSATGSLRTGALEVGVFLPMVRALELDGIQWFSEEFSVRAAVGCRAQKVEKVENGRGERTEASTSLTRGKECGTTRVPMCIVLVGRCFALRKWLATLPLTSRPMWRGQLTCTL
jgi:hypothetical protein